ncbi:MAG: hypothetical protein LBT05_10950 [Planctomycetaceae bacterium]|jgi:hypothetical protein|nr:hypothetical protein [Planctomycetaceae bacterium]
MTHEIRNLKGEIIDETSDEKWYHFSVNTWLFIGGLILLNISCFAKPNLLDAVFRQLDVRLWKWWYFIFLALLIAFSVKWFFIYRNWEDYDEMEIDEAKRFNRMAIAMIVVMAVLVLLNTTRIILALYYPLLDWLTRGVFSGMALLSFMLICSALIPTIYFFKEWIVTFLNE